jgi:shikimate dehydrogenase
MSTIALIGDPVAHSVSPSMQQAAFDAKGLRHTYIAVRVGRDDLRRELERLRDECTGLNVTRPLKEDVLPLLDSVSGGASLAGSVNTVVIRDGRTEGHSTDGPGFMAALGRRVAGVPARSLILGTGGAARAVAAALAGAGSEVVVAGRDAGAGQAIATSLGVRFVPLGSVREAPDLLVNATPLGGASGDLPPLDGIVLRPGATVFDLVYRPRSTPLLRLGAERGCTGIEGIEMLIEQGARSFELWTGLPAPVAVMRTAAYQALRLRPKVEAPR